MTRHFSFPMTAIEIENLSKQYALGKIGSGTLYRDLNVWWARMRGKPNPYQKIGQINDRTQKTDGDYVWALQDINLKIEEGEVVGIIGSNGAGKSTLLKILSRVTTPTTGRITTYGRVASLLEVGTGFHPEMTGRENIYMNGAIMGMIKAEIDRKLDEIIDFAGVEKYIDTPVKRYSSGMTVRLGFAVAAFLEPEILVVDEVLAVGDIEFQKKAIGKMKEVSRGEERTVLFVSHNMAAVRSLCQRGIVLQNGMLIYDGDANSAVDKYLSFDMVDFHRETFITEDYRRKNNFTKEVEIVYASIDNDDIRKLSTDGPIYFTVKVRRNNKHVDRFNLGFHITDNEQKRVGAYISPVIEFIRDQEEMTIHMTFSNHNLAKGQYYVDFNACIKDVRSGERIFDVTFNVLSFEIVYLSNNYVIGYWPNHWGHIHFQNVEINVE